MGFAISLNAVLITGLTASGKSALAIALARALEGVGGRNRLVLNADASQVYRGLETLTAQPDAEERAGVVHRLFGFVPPQEAYSVGRWLADVEQVLREDCLPEDGAEPIFCGGSGLYLRVLTEGLAEVPEVASEVRVRLEARLEEIGVSAFYEELRELDTQEAARLADKNPRRLLRSREVLEATGKPLHYWWKKDSTPLIHRALWVVLLPDLQELELAIAQRAPYLVGTAGQEEVRTLKKTKCRFKFASVVQGFGCRRSRAGAKRHFVRRTSRRILGFAYPSICTPSACLVAKALAIWHRRAG